jgi:hypothetical protein
MALGHRITNYQFYALFFLIFIKFDISYIALLYLNTD